MPDDRTFLSENISLVDGLLNKFIRMQQNTTVGTCSSILNVINGHVEYRKKLIKRIVEENGALIERFQQFSKEACERNKLNSGELNFFRLFPLGETGHSYQLAKFLNPYAEHGQGKLFLMEFLKMLRIAEPEKGQWIVTAEKGRIDVLLKRRAPRSAVIIENKSNDAVDQPNQLYRYWYQEIYYPNRDKPVDYAYHHPDCYRIIYLPSSSSKKPDDNSLQKPKDEMLDASLPEKMPMEIDCWSFDKQIIRWLGKCHEQLPKNNFRMRDYVNQYIELWRG